MDLIIKNKIFKSDIEDVLHKLKYTLHDGRFKDIYRKGDNVICTCPFHKGGMENKPAMNIYCNRYGSVEYGYSHCFSCGYSGRLSKFIGDVFNADADYGEDWLLENFSYDIVFDDGIVLDEIILPKQSDCIESKLNKKCDSETEVFLEKCNIKHPYMYRRGLTDKIIEKFHIGYNAERDTITFPVWDEFGSIVMVTERSTKDKRFYIPPNVEKPVYLLNYILKEKIQRVFVCESQLNTLNCWKYGFPAIGLFGTGSQYQYDIMRKSGIRNYVLMFDGDSAGRIGADKFKKNLSDCAYITDVVMYAGKDVTDLSKNEFFTLLESNQIYS